MDTIKIDKGFKKKEKSTLNVLIGQLKTNWDGTNPCSTDIMNEVYASTPKGIMGSALNILKDNGWTVEEKDNKLFIS